MAHNVKSTHPLVVEPLAHLNILCPPTSPHLLGCQLQGGQFLGFQWQRFISFSRNTLLSWSSSAWDFIFSLKSTLESVSYNIAVSCSLSCTAGHDFILFYLTSHFKTCVRCEAFYQVLGSGRSWAILVLTMPLSHLVGGEELILRLLLAGVNWKTETRTYHGRFILERYPRQHKRKNIQGNSDKGEEGKPVQEWVTEPAAMVDHWCSVRPGTSGQLLDGPWYPPPGTWRGEDLSTGLVVRGAPGMKCPLPGLYLCQRGFLRSLSTTSSCWEERDPSAVSHGHLATPAMTSSCTHQKGGLRGYDTTISGPWHLSFPCSISMIL